MRRRGALGLALVMLLTVQLRQASASGPLKFKDRLAQGRASGHAHLTPLDRDDGRLFRRAKNSRSFRQRSIDEVFRPRLSGDPAWLD